MTASQPNCAYCSQELQGFQQSHICPKCGKPQPLTEKDNFFAVLGESPRLRLDVGQLEKRFYEISRTLHPDRFSAAGGTVKQVSVERMGRVNDAWRTLKSPTSRRSYFLKLSGYEADPSKKHSPIPGELAEGWFDLQDALAESPELATQKLAHFEKELAAFVQTQGTHTQDLEAQIDLALEKSAPDETLHLLLEKLSNRVLAENYLNSLAQDIDRIKKRLH